MSYERPCHTGPVLTCACCGRYQVEEVLLDRLRGAGPRRRYRLIQRTGTGVYVVAEASSLDDLAAVLDTRGILMWPDDGCE